MHKKAAAEKGQKAIREHFDKLGSRLGGDVERIEKLIEATSIPSYAALPSPQVLENLMAECDDSPFWQNFKRAAPILFCSAIEDVPELKTIRDMSFIEELLKTKSIMKLMKDKLDAGAADVDIVEYSLATKMLENKLAVLQALNITVTPEDGKITLNVKGSGKAIRVDLAKLKEAIEVVDVQVEEHEGKPIVKAVLEDIDIEGLTEEQFLEKASEKILPVNKTANKTLAKDSFIKIFKYCGDLAKMKSKEVKKIAQANRMQFFEVDSNKYLEAMKESVAVEEQVYEASSQMLFEKICISPEMFERSQGEMMNDPYIQMELFQMGISMEKPSGDPPEGMDKEMTVKMVMESNDYAFDFFKKEYMSQMQFDPFMIPVLISAIAHDYIFKKYKHDEDAFKCALFVHKIYEDESVAMHMQQK